MRKQWAYNLGFYRIRILLLIRLALLQEQHTLTLGQEHQHI